MTRFGVEDYDKYWRTRKERGRTAFTHIHQKIVEVMSQTVTPGGAILDCGVGPAQAYTRLAQQFQMYGVEISSEAIALYDFDTSRIRQANLNDGLPDFGISFDGIIASMIIHHLDEPPRFLADVKQRLAKGGVFLAVHPNIAYYRQRLKYLFTGAFPTISTAHKIFLTHRQFQELLEKAGFRIERITTPKRKPLAKLLPQLFSQDLFYICRVA